MGKGPELFRFTEELEAEAGNQGEMYYIQRPEVIESFFVLYRVTKDPKYREWGWAAAQSIDRWGKAGPNRGYAGLRNVYDSRPEQDDIQQSFFLAETLKVQKICSFECRKRSNLFFIEELCFPFSTCIYCSALMI